MRNDGDIMTKKRLSLVLVILTILSLSCRAADTLLSINPSPSPTPEKTPTALPIIPIQPGTNNPDEPVVVYGKIPYTSPFFLNSTAEPFVMLEDEAGFVHRDLNFSFSETSQVIAPVTIGEDKSLSYELTLPAIPQATMVDVDNNGNSDKGVQIFAIAYWSNTWGDPFLEKRDGTGWSTAYASTIIDPESKGEISGGILLVWAPDAQQGFPTGFGPDRLLFTKDDPTGPIPAGYTYVDMNQEPFRFYKKAQEKIDLNEGSGNLKDYSNMSYSEAFKTLFNRVSTEYPFTEEKGIKWQELSRKYQPQADAAQNDQDFYRAVRDFTWGIPDGHASVSLNNQVFFKEAGGGLGLVLDELSDGRVIVTHVLSDTPGSEAGIKPGAEILSWNNQPVAEAIQKVTPYFGPYSTEHTRHINQLVFLTRGPIGTIFQATFRNPGEAEASANLKTTSDIDSLVLTIPSLNQSALSMPVDGKMLPGTKIGYIRITTFNDDYNLMARQWERYIKDLVDNEVAGLIIDIRNNGGGNSALGTSFAGYFFDKELDLYQESYYNEKTGAFEMMNQPTQIFPGPIQFKGPIAVLIGPNCASACEGFAYALSQQDRSILVGHYPTAGMFGEVGRGQYKLPGDMTAQYPTGRPNTLDGKILIEGTGVVPSITVPVTFESAMGMTDAVLEAAIRALQEKLK